MTEKIRLLITGANGQVGKSLLLLKEQYPQFEFFTYTKEELDITNFQRIEKIFQKHRPHYCINCAAYTAVDKAESQGNRAKVINITGVFHLTTACKLTNTRFIQLSSDYVYHNDLNRPLVETDPTYPKGKYAQTKLEGDQQALKYPASIIIRTSWVYAPFGHNFVRTMLRLGKVKDTLTVVNDQIGAPTYSIDLAKAILTIIEQIEDTSISFSDLAGIYHYSNEGVCSWYDFAMSIFELANINCKVVPIQSKDYPTPAPRPSYSVLNKTKIKTTFNLSIPHWRASLKKCLQEIKSEESTR